MRFVMTENDTLTQSKELKKLEFLASRRSSAEIEELLKGFLKFIQRKNLLTPEIFDDVDSLLQQEDENIRNIFLGGEVENVPDVLRYVIQAFLMYWKNHVRQTIQEQPDTTKPRHVPSVHSARHEHPFVEGEWVVFYDAKGRTYLCQLRSGTQFTFHHGALPLDDVIGKSEGTVFKTNKGAHLVAFRPTLKEYLLKMPRHAQVVYPKDSGVIVLWADLRPGLRVLESGLGSGALALVILKEIGPTGQLVSYEIRHSFIQKAKRNIERYFGYEPENHIIHCEDITRARIESESFDRVFLDLPTPTEGLASASAGLKPGGLLVSISPTIPQIQETVEWLRASHMFVNIEVLENLLRPWHIRGHSVRPAHRMVAHTTFIVVARKILPGQSFRDDSYF